MNVRLYILQRATAALMAPLVLIHIAVIFYASHKGLSAADILARTRGSVAWGLFYGVFVAAIAVHASIGLRTILTEWAGLRGVSRRKWPVTTVRAAQARPAPDLVQRAFTATGPNQLWVADITYIPTWSGTLYLAVVLDVWSRRIVGWAMATHLRASLVVAALDMAVVQRRPHDVIHHSDQGCQYTAIEFGRRCREANVRPSMGSVGDCYDNALCESFFATLECELLDRVTLRTPADARTAVFDFIEGWYNPTRRHSSLDYESPIAFERRQAKITQKQQMTGDADAGRGQTTVGRSIASLTADGELPGIEG